MAVGALEPQFYEQLLIGLELSDTENVTKDVLEKCFKTKTRDEWDGIFKNLDACTTPVLDLDKVHLNKHNQERKSFLVVKDGQLFPKMNWHDIDESGDNLKLPLVGQSTLSIMQELGYSMEKIKLLEQQNVLKLQKINSNL
jgi:alpha-methylacyl-CoA racemase